MNPASLAEALKLTPRKLYRLWRDLSPAQLFVGSFFVLIVVGTLALRWLPGLYTGERLGWIDALFVATSAVCITGLTVVDTATYFTPAGQAVILTLVQLGGLGMITFTTVIIVALGRRLSLRQEAVTASFETVAPHVDYRRLVRTIFKFTFMLEAGGALVLYLAWIPRFGIAGALWPAVFHAVNAFCNAGFSTFSDSLMSFQRAPITQLVVMALIVVGGLGFLTIEELRMQRAARRTRQRFRLSLHSRLALATTAVLLLGGWIFFTCLEWRGVLAGMPAWARVLNGLFMSVTTRSSGFSTIDYQLASDGTNFLSIILMFIGGSPGSTAGGVKTTTFAVIGLLAWSRFRGRRIPVFWERSIPDETVQRAIGLFVVAFGVITLAILAYTITEIGGQPGHGDFLRYMFEATSAFNTVGLTMGVTDELSTIGRVLTAVLMYVGRVGPLTFAAAIALRSREPIGKFRYAHEDVVVG